MKCLKLFFLLILSLALFPLVHAVTLTPYPDVEIRLSAYDTYLMWTSTLTFDSITVNTTHANFTNIHMGTGYVLATFIISQQNSNSTLTQLAQANTTIFTVTGLGNSTTRLTLPVCPDHVYLNGALITVTTSQHGYAWDSSTSTLTLWTVQTASSQWTLTGTLGGTPFRPQNLSVILAIFYLAITLFGLVPIVFVIVAFVKWQLDVKVAISIILSIIIIMIAVLIIITFMSAVG